MSPTVTGTPIVSPIEFSLLSMRRLEEAYDKCLEELRESVENVRAGYFQTDVQPMTSTPIKKTARVLFNPVYMSPQVEVEKHNNVKTSSKTSVLAG